MKLNIYKLFNTLLYIFVIFSLFSCSMLSKRNSLVDQNNKNAQNGKNFVSKAQYDDLKKRFDVAMQQNKVLKARLSPNEKIERIKNSKNKQTQALESINANGLEETVDLFENAKTTIPILKKNRKNLNNKQIQKQLSAISKAEHLIFLNKLDQAMAILKTIESSALLPVAAWSKYLIGEIMFKQSEYDLAMQLYEEVIYKYAQSSVVLLALKKLIICTDKLKLLKKNKKYSSFYYDLFGMKI